MSPCLALRLLGPPQLRIDDKLVMVDRRIVVALIAYLAAEDMQRTGQGRSREFLSGLLWPDLDQSKAYANLRHTLWEIRRSIGKGWVVANRESVGLQIGSDISLDVSQFQELINRSHQVENISQRVSFLVEAAGLYRNHFLTGFSLREASDFNEWIYSQAETYRLEMIEVLSMLVEGKCMLGQAEAAIPYGRRLVAFDPLNENAHRRLMQVYMQAGQHSAALKQYQDCEKILRKELGLDPQPETRELYKQVRRGGNIPSPGSKPALSWSPRHNLPVQLSTFIGREKERTEICELLAGKRLVTLVGSGGIGKTRLALKVGEKLQGDNPDGVWFLPLDALSDPNHLPRSLATLFHLREIWSRSVMEQLLDMLCSKTLLLIMDNCEHLRDACVYMMTKLLAGCPQIKILATSREVLGVEGETIYTVPPLTLPEVWEVAPLVTKESEFEALHLFKERAGLILPTFKVSQENIEVITAICRRLDGIPLAIELAAARVDILQPQELFDQLNASFALLSHRGFATVPRHQSMRASMDWSWNLLSKSEQSFLRKLSVFVGGWTLEAAQEICDKQALLFLDALSAKSLLIVQRIDGQATRYYLHEIIRQYLVERLSQANDVTQLRKRHLQYYLSLAEQAEPAFHNRSSGDWLRRLNYDHGNLRAALDWAEKTDVQAGLNLLSWLKPFWHLYDLREATRLLEIFLAKTQAQAYPAERARALATQSFFLNLLQQTDAAHNAAQVGLDLARACGDGRIEIDCLLAMSDLCGGAGHKEFGVRALSLARALNDHRREALALVTLAWEHANYDRDRAKLEKAIHLFRLLGDTGDLMANLCDLGYIEFSCGDYDNAQRRFDEVIVISQGLDLPSYRMSTLFSRGIIAWMNGDLEQARIYLEEFAELIDVMGDRMITLVHRARLGHLALRQGEIPKTRALLRQCTQEFFIDRSEIGLAYTFEGIAALSVAVGRHEIAARLIGWADAVRIKIGDLRPDAEQADVDRSISACVLEMGEEAFSDAYDAGQAMTIEEAVSCAVKENESVIQ